MRTMTKWMAAIGFVFVAQNCVALDFGQALKDKLNAEAPKLVEVMKEVRGPDESEEIAIGRQIAGNLLGAAPLVKDARLQKYVNQVGDVGGEPERTSRSALAFRRDPVR